MKKHFQLLALVLFAILSINSFAQTYNMSNTSVSTCTGTFYDSGGPSSNYANNENFTMTFTSDNGNRLQFNFSSFVSESYDKLYVYDGNSVNAPLIATYTGTYSAFSIQSSGSSLTFKFTSDVSNVYAGWTASITCTTPILTSYPMLNGQTVNGCSGVFYDDAGSSASYSNSQNNVMTFCPSTANDYLVFSFPNQFDIATDDTLFVYSGTTATTTPIGIYTGVNKGAVISSPLAGACVTFKFVSNGTNVSAGWQAFITCSTTPPSFQMNMVSGTINTCGGYLYDSGGANGYYGNSETKTITLASNNGNRILLNFNSFVTESYDKMYIYDGTSVNSPLIGTYYGVLSAFSVQSSGTALTVKFVSDGSNIYTGWAAAISCTTAALTSYPITNGQTTTACNGVFYDNGDNAGNYSNLQNSTMTFCPSSPSDYLVLSFPYQFNIATDDTLFVYSGTSTNTTPIGIYTGINTGAVITSPQAGACITFRFVSNGSNVAAGWQGFISCSTAVPSFQLNMVSGTINTCGGYFYDSGGATGNYGISETKTVTLASNNGNRIQLNFSSFVTESYDKMYIYDGPSVNSPLIATYYGTLSAFSVQSSGTALTVKFTSDGSGVYAGWAASISCTTPALTSYPISNGQTINGCGGVFYDNGDNTGSYSNLLNSTMTFCPSTVNDYLVISFPYQFDIATDDTLFVYSGTTTSTTPIGVYTGINKGAVITSPQAGACITFKFVSNGSNVSAGWQGFITCSTAVPAFQMNMVSGTINTCGGYLYDSGGATGNYGISETKTLTLSSNNGNRIQLNFSSFVSESYDKIYIYDGPSVNSPLIATYYGTLSAFSVQSSGTALTLKFTSDASGVYAGWAAAISCTTPALTSYPMTNGQTITGCGGVFYDNGDNTGSYTNLQNATMTFCPSTVNDYLVFSFPYQFDIATDDTLFVYSGTGTTSTPIGKYTGSNKNAVITSPIPGGCLTFKFVSNGANVSAGWQGFITCSTAAPAFQMNMVSGTINTCDAYFYDSGGNSNTYGTSETKIVTFSSTSGCGIKCDFTSFVTESYDKLYVYDGPSIQSTLIGTYYGTLSAFAVQSTGTSLTFRFTSDASSVYAGWAAHISCPNTPVATITPSGPTDFCTGDSVTLTASSASSYLWSNNATTQAITVYSGGVFTVTVTNSLGCVGNSQPVSVAVSPLPANAGIISGNTTVCQGPNTVTYSVPLITNATSYIWTLPSGAIGSSTTNSINVIYGSSATSGLIKVKGHSACGNGVESSLNVTVSPLPANAGTISGDNTVCQSQTALTYAVPAINNASSYIWTIPTGATGSSTTNSISVTFGTSSVSGNITVKGHNSCGDGTISILPVSISAYPPTPTITLNGNVLHSSAATGNQWYLNGSVISNATSQDYTVTQNGSYTVEVTNSNGCSTISAAYVITTVTVEKLHDDNTFIIAPNPSNGIFRIKTSINQNFRIRIFNALGQIIYHSEIFNPEIDLSNQPKGVYFIEFKSNDKCFNKKLILQ